jgi:hypothetical protein
MHEEIGRSSQKYLGLQSSGVKNEHVLQILRLEAEVEVALQGHPTGRDQLCLWCGGTMPDILPPSNVGPIVEGRQPTLSYQPLGVMLKPLGIRKQLVAHVTTDICLQARHVLLHELL